MTPEKPNPRAINDSAIVPESLAGERFDRIAAELFPDFSRATLQAWIKQGSLLADGKQLKVREKLYQGVELKLNAELEDNDQWQAEDIPLDIAFEDESLLVINKPAGLVVHPAAGNRTGTLLNALLFHYPDAASLPRAGIVHRLDKDTTGLMVVARTLPAHHGLVSQLQDKTIHRDYQALVFGEMTGGGSVDAPIGRHPQHRTKMAVEELHGKPAVTHYRIRQRFKGMTLLDVSLETGRTHQIRVHMAHINHPIVGDPAYGGRRKIPPAASQDLVDALKNFPRQALHACRLGLTHPQSGEAMQWECELPDDMQELLDILLSENL